MAKTFDYFLIAESATTDNKGRVSLANIFDTANVKNLPFTPAKFVIAFSLFLNSEAVKEESELKIVFTHRESEEEVYSASTVIQPYKKVDKFKVVKLVSALDVSKEIRFSKAGFYTYSLFVNGILLAQNEFKVIEEGS